MATSPARQHIESIAREDESRRPDGIVDWMHYGFFLRYRPEPQVAATEDWVALDSGARELNCQDLDDAVSLLESRAWSAGHLALRNLAEMAWERLTPTARGRFLAGLAINFRFNMLEMDPPGAWIGDWLLLHLADGIFDSEAAAEVGANAAANGHVELLRALLDRADLPAEAVPRLTGSRQQYGFEKQIGVHATRLLDVMFEAAVRCQQLETARLLLQCGADPNIPCWNLERSFQEWFSALSFLIDECEGSTRMAMVELLLEAGADPTGLPCEERNKPLFLALQKKDWLLADKLLSCGARFDGGEDAPAPVTAGGETTILSPRVPYFGFFSKDMEWVKGSIRPLFDMPEIPSTPHFYCANAQGGSHQTFLGCFLYGNDLEHLRRYEAAGLPTSLSIPEFLTAVSWGAYEVLCHLLRDHPHLPRIMFRIRRRHLQFGTSQHQLLLGRPELSETNRLASFNTHGQEPLILPDGGKVYACLDVIAPPEHEHGPITEGCLWVNTVSAEHRRRADHIEVRNVKRIWRMVPIPIYDGPMKQLIPLVREVEGQFYWLGITMHSLPFSQRVPESFRPQLSQWCDGPAWQHIRQKFIDLGKAQTEANKHQPDPVLSEEELDGYPREFWPWLRRLPDSHVGMTQESCALNPDILDLYQVWERQNKPDYSRKVDARCETWLLWKDVPIEHRPYYEWSDLFGKPTIRMEGANEYQKAMIRKAANWSLQSGIEALKRHEAGDPKALEGWAIDAEKLDGLSDQNR